MNRRALALCAGLLLLALAPGSALATSVVDQKNEVDNTGWGGTATSTFAQTFTVGMTGKLTAVDMRLSKATSVSVSVYLQALVSGNPSGTNLASGSALVHFIAWYHFPLSTPLSVTAGGKYAIVFTMGVGGTANGSISGDKYPGGQALIKMGSWTPQAGADFEFRTYVEQAAPTPKPTPKPTPAPTPAPTATTAPVVTESATASPTSVQTASSTGTEPAASAAPGATATPSPQPDSGSGGSALPIVAAGIVALGLALGGLGFVLARRRRARG